MLGLPAAVDFKKVDNSWYSELFADYKGHFWRADLEKPVTGIKVVNRFEKVQKEDDRIKGITIDSFATDGYLDVLLASNKLIVRKRDRSDVSCTFEASDIWIEEIQ